MRITKMLQCKTRVNKSAIKRCTINGVEHISVSSSTLPDDIVMNGDLYPAEEIAKSFQTLERTLAPVEHPTDPDGNYISASDPYAINNFYAGAYNVNVKRENGRVHLEKMINVQEALKTDRGKRLLDRINELETSKNPRAIHTSVGVWVDIEELDEPKVNSEGQEYKTIARNMVFDHDAILLDSVGAAKPSQGVGIAVNADGKKVQIQVCSLDDNKEEFEIKHYDAFIEQHDLTVNEMTFSQIVDGLDTSLWAKYKDLNNPPYVYILHDSITASSFVYSEDEVLYKASYSIDTNGMIQIQDDREEVRRSVEYTPTNPPTEDSSMRETILAKLKELGIIITNDNKISDSDLLAKYDEALNASNGDDNARNDQVRVNKDLMKANGELAEEVKTLKSQLKAHKDQEISKQVATIRACSKYSAIPESVLTHMAHNEAEEFNKLLANAKPSYGIAPNHDFNQGSGDADDDSMFQVNGDRDNGQK